MASFRLNKYVQRAFTKDSENNVVIFIGALNGLQCILSLQAAVKVYRYLFTIKSGFVVLGDRLLMVQNAVEK